MIRQAVILAGGKGTRLRSRLGSLPKPLVDLCGSPLLEHQILLARNYGVKRVTILTSHLAEKILQFCKSRDNWGMEIDCLNDAVPRGTAGAVLDAFDHLEDEFFVIYGDTMLNVELGRFYALHQSKGVAAATLLIHPNDHPEDSDLVEIDETARIVAFHPYPHKEGDFLPNLVNAALYIMRKDAIAPWRDWRDGIVDFGKDLFPEMIAAGQFLCGYESSEYIKDCGTPERLDRVSTDYMCGRIARASLDRVQNMVFLDRDGTLNPEVGRISHPDQLELFAGAAEAIRRLNKLEWRTCLVTNQPVLARGDCNLGDLKRIHNKLETLLGKAGAYLDRIYFCPHHPDRGFEGEVAELKVECACRKPATGMIEKALFELNGNRATSWMIGDTTSDILAARRAGIRSVLVMTGYGGRDAKYDVEPDYIAENLAAAVDIVASRSDPSI